MPTPTLPVRPQRRFGWRPDTPDIRDHLLGIEPPKKLPAKVSLRSKMPSVWDQGALGSCTAFAISALIAFDEKKQGRRMTRPSFLFLYYNERVMEDTINEDAGAEIRDGIKSVAKVGLAPAVDWPYEIDRFATRPPSKAYKDALKYRALNYARVPQTRSSMMSVLASGFPFVFGFGVYETFMSDQVANDGLVPMPNPSEEMVGGHAVVCTGYDTTRVGHLFQCRNSWDDSWGDGGYFYMPGQYLSDRSLSSDFWVVRQVT